MAITDEDVRHHSTNMGWITESEFDHWLAAHDAEVWNRAYDRGRRHLVEALVELKRAAPKGTNDANNL